jgi:hypothetical protein
MLPVLQSRGVAAQDRIETVLPDLEQDRRSLFRFKEGRIRILEKRNAQARRFSIVYSADVIASLEGEQGTRSVLDLALAIERPVLPLPFGGRASADVWNEQRKAIVDTFQITPDDVKLFERIDFAKLGETELRQLAARVHACLMRGFTRSCFVIMRFHQDSDPVYDNAIQPAIATCGFQAWRTDRSVATGDVVAAIRDGISHCFFAIADTTDDRPNVMYELGFAHAIDKPVILLRRTQPEGSFPPPPFDFQTQSILPYSLDKLPDLRRRLEDTIAGLTMIDIELRR